MDTAMDSPGRTKGSERAAAESRFYDRYAEQVTAETLSPLQVFAPTCLENLYVLEQFGNLRGQRVLDIGCGQGDTSVFFALRGAEVCALDVSQKMVELTGALAGAHGVGDRVRARACRVEDMDYPDQHFDLVFADGVLHHLDMAAAVPNIVRVMKSGGRGIFLEPQKGSIFSEIYRVFAKDLRTTDERPLEPRDFDFLASQFGHLDHREYHLVSLLLFTMRFVTLKLSGKAFPYWMDDVRQGKYHPRLLQFLQTIDDRLLRCVPRLRRYTWMTVITARKTVG
jgi:SAM-dependent methyltransferase